MSTIYDFLTVAIFAGLVVLFLQRSVGEAPLNDHMWHYLVAATGCAVANYAGNQGYAAIAVLIILMTLAFIYYVLRPFPKLPPS